MVGRLLLTLSLLLFAAAGPAAAAPQLSARDARLAVVVDALPAVPPIPSQLPSELIARRPDVVAAERGVAAANADIGVAITAWLPTISLGASGGVSGESVSDLWNAPVRFWSVGPSLA